MWKQRIYRLRALLYVVALWMLASCQSQQTPEQLFEEQAPGVVVIMNKYYYELNLPNGNSLYFTGIDQDGDLENFTPEEDEVKKKQRIMTGTGFFIDDKGTIMTNRHVAMPSLDQSQVKAAFANFIKNLKQVMALGMNQMRQQYAELESQKSDSYTYDPYTGNTYYDAEKVGQIEQQQAEMEQNYNEAQESFEAMSQLTDPSSLKITTRNRVGIAYNDTYVTSENDFWGNNECVVTKVSQADDADLALIQLKNKTTPQKAFIFDVKGTGEKDSDLIDKVKGVINGQKDNGELTINEDLYMIGYNAGLALGITKQGIKAQLTSGRLSQAPDGQRLLYSIPTVQGSSGSPVIDATGRFVGVNFAKFTGSDNFNFGIPASKVIKFLAE